MKNKQKLFNKFPIQKHSKYTEGRYMYANGIKTKLSTECIPVQLHGLKECNICLLKNDSVCGGTNIKKTGKNKKGFKVPLKEEENYEVTAMFQI
jgi:hypothetical protein